MKPGAAHQSHRGAKQPLAVPAKPEPAGPAPAPAGASPSGAAAPTGPAAQAHGAGAWSGADERARQGPAWLREVRAQAVGRLRSPHTGTRLETLAKALPVAERAGSQVTQAELAQFHFPGEGARIVFVDGHHVPGLSTAALPRGARLVALSQGPSEAAEEHLNRHADPDEPDVALNVLEMRDAAVLELAPRTVVEDPVHLLFVHSGHAPAAAHNRVLILAGKGSQCTVVEQHVGFGTAQTLSSAVVELVADADAVVRHVKVQRECLRCDHFARLEVRQQPGSQVETFLLSLGGNEVQNRVETRLQGKGCSATVDGIFLAAGHQRVDCTTRIEHAAPDTTSLQLYKGILDGRSRGSFTGMVTVQPDAQKTNAQQTNRNLLLSSEALVASTPQLEIHADDVKCSHGSTIGRLDDSALFFLRSRGLDPEAARLMLTQAFAREALERIRHDGIRRLLDGLVTAWFTGRRDLQAKGWPA